MSPISSIREQGAGSKINNVLGRALLRDAPIRKWVGAGALQVLCQHVPVMPRVISDERVSQVITKTAIS
jgi:hypothetical protein